MSQCYIQSAHFQNGLPLVCVVKCLPHLQKAHFIRKSPGGFGIQTLNGITLPLVSLWETRKVARFSSSCTADIIKPCFEADVFFFPSRLFLRYFLRHGRIRHHEKQNKKKASKKRANGVFVWPNSLSLGGPSHGNKALCPFSGRPPPLHTHLSTSFTQLLSVIAFTLVILLIMSFLGIRCNFMLQDSVCDDLCGS